MYFDTPIISGGIYLLSVSSVYITTSCSSVGMASMKTPSVHSADSLCVMTWSTGLGYECELYWGMSVPCGMWHKSM